MGQQKFSTSFERIFKHKPNGLYQEFTLFFVHTHDPQTGNILKSNLDKITTGKLYRRGSMEERAFFGDEIVYFFSKEAGPSKMIPVINMSELSCKRLTCQQI